MLLFCFIFTAVTSLPQNLNALEGIYNLDQPIVADAPIQYIDNLDYSLPADLLQKLKLFNCTDSIKQCGEQFKRDFTKTEIALIKEETKKSLVHLPATMKQTLMDIYRWSTQHSDASVLQLNQKIAVTQSQANLGLILTISAIVIPIVLTLYISLDVDFEQPGERDCRNSFSEIRSKFSKLNIRDYDAILVANSKSAAIKKLGALQSLCDKVGMHFPEVQYSNSQCTERAIEDWENLIKVGPKSWVNATESIGETILRCHQIDEETIRNYEIEMRSNNESQSKLKIRSLE
jgi:hypothetical protein